MSKNYKLLEAIETQNGKGSYNVYVTEDRVFFVSIDDYTSELRKISKTSGRLGAIGAPFGLLGVLLVTLPVGVFFHPRYKKAKRKALDEMREISIHEIETSKGYGCMRQDMRFEKKKKERYRVHLGENWLLLSDVDASSIQAIN